MAAIKATFTGVICDLYGRVISGPMKMIGELAYSDLHVGGGPIVPPPGSGGDGDHIWGPTDPRPTPPIAFPPGWVGGVPPIGGGPPVDPPVNPPDDDGFLKPPPPDGGWAYHQTYGWGMYPAPGQPGPKT